MSNFELEVKKREAGKKGRREAVEKNLIPAVVYGHGVKNQSLEVPAVSFKKIFKAAGTNTLVWLKTDSDKRQVLIYDYQKDPVTSEFIHVDFYAVNMLEKIIATVPLKFIGVSLAVKDKGGVLVKNMEEVKVKCLPKDLPHELEVDISSLHTFEDRFRISDLKLGADVEILVEDKNLIIANAILPKEEVVEVGKPTENVQAVEGVKTEADAAAGEGSKKDVKKEGQREAKKEPKK